MTDADLTLRDEVAEVLGEHNLEVSRYALPGPGYVWGCECNATGVCPDRPHEHHARHLADALLPLLARVREEGEARVRERVEALAAEWEGWAKVRSTPRIDAFRDAAERLRAALAEPSGEDAGD